MKVKICGLKSKDEVIASNKADYIGFVVGSPRSKRNIGLDKMKSIAAVTITKTVAVTVNPDIDFINKICQHVDIVQLHGSSRKHIENINCDVGIGLSIEEYTDYKNLDLSYIVIDSSSNYGGTGDKWNWERINKNNEVLIAGGISINNYKEAISITGADGIDISSSLEVNGMKSISKITQLLAEADKY